MRLRTTAPELEYVLRSIGAIEPDQKNGFRVIELYLESSDGTKTPASITMAQMDFDRIAKIVADVRNVTAA